MVNLEKAERYYKDKNKEDKIKKVILDNAKKKGHILHGQRALNSFFPPHLDRRTDDWDLFSDAPLRTAQKVEKRLDKRFGGDFFRVEKAKNPTTYKVRSNVTEKTVADYTDPQEDIPFVTRNGVRHATISHHKERIRETLADKQKEFRHKKDRETLQRIKIFEKTRKQKRKQPKSFLDNLPRLRGGLI
jgi:hypothetical protein